MAADPGAGPEIPRQRPKDYRLEFLSFKDWLLWKHSYTPEQLYDLCLATGSYGDYDRVMAWYRRSYRQYNEQRELLRAAVPFDNNYND